MSTKPSDRVSRVRASRARRNAGSRLENMCTEGPQPSTMQLRDHVLLWILVLP